MGGRSTKRQRPGQAVGGNGGGAPGAVTGEGTADCDSGGGVLQCAMDGGALHSASGRATPQSRHWVTPYSAPQWLQRAWVSNVSKDFKHLGQRHNAPMGG